VAAAICVSGVVASATAGAHIILVSDGGASVPKDWLVMTDVYGDPQKPTPCGGTGTPTNIVTAYHTGESVTLTWTEAIAHSGHFRIAFAPVSPAAATAAILPDPVVTTYTNSSNTEASAVAVTETGGSISAGGVVLADNLFPHCIAGDPCPTGVPVTGAPKTYSATVTMPTTPCTNCTLQLVQFMSYHPIDPSFFYHHCAAVTLTAPPAEDAGKHGGGDAGSHGTTGTDAGSSSGNAGSGGDAVAAGQVQKAPTSTSSGCSLTAGRGAGAEWILGLLALPIARRRARRQRA
jgi:hypothetical protein